MTGLAGLVSTDSRKPLQRLRRTQLYAMADMDKLTYSVGAPHTAMVPLLEAAGISGLEDRFNSITRFRQIIQQDESGRQHIELYPDHLQHHTADKEIDYSTAIDHNAEQAKPAEPNEDELFLKAEVESLRKRNAELEKTINERLTKLENLPAATGSTPAFPLERLLPWQLMHMAKERGIEYKGLSKEELVDALKE